MRRGVDYLMQARRTDGSWYGRWGVDYIYGTCLALRGLAAAGENDREAHMLRAGEWLRSIQNADGGWGESCASYDNDDLHAGPEHAVADSLGGAGPDRRRRHRRAAACSNGIEYLLETQRADGSWDEELSTGTGFPRVFYLKYHLYRALVPAAGAVRAIVKSRGANG